jgi:hypothetical protein
MDNIQKFTYNHSKFATDKKTIMICEDEPDVLLSFELILDFKYKPFNPFTRIVASFLGFCRENYCH